MSSAASAYAERVIGMVNTLGIACLLGVLSALWPPPAAAAESPAAAQRAYEACIVRYGSNPPSPQAAVILQRACFYKHAYGKSLLPPEGAAGEHRRLSRIYTPEVCDCVFEKLPAASAATPAPAVLDRCVKSAAQKPRPEGN